MCALSLKANVKLFVARQKCNLQIVIERISMYFCTGYILCHSYSLALQVIKHVAELLKTIHFIILIYSFIKFA